MLRNNKTQALGETGCSNDEHSITLAKDDSKQSLPKMTNAVFSQ